MVEFAFGGVTYNREYRDIAFRGGFHAAAPAIPVISASIRSAIRCAGLRSWPTVQSAA